MSRCRGNTIIIERAEIEKIHAALKHGNKKKLAADLGLHPEALSRYLNYQKSVGGFKMPATLYKKLKLKINLMSKETYLKGLPAHERATVLRENAVTQYNKNVVRNYSEEELTGMKHELSEVAISINDCELEKAEVTKDINERIKAQKVTKVKLLKGLKDKYYETLETVFDIANHEDSIMETYNADGELIGTRRLTPAEKQTIIPLSKAI